MCDGKLKQYLDEGNVVITARVNSVLLAFAQCFLQMGVGFVFVGKAAIKKDLEKLIKSFEVSALPSHASSPTHHLALISHPTLPPAQASMLEEVIVAAHTIVSDDVSPTVMYQDYAACVLVLAKAVKERIGAAECREATSMVELFDELDRVFPERDIHAKVRARRTARRLQPLRASLTRRSHPRCAQKIVVLANAHQIKGHTFTTTIIAEPSFMRLQHVIDAGGQLAQDEKNIECGRASNRAPPPTVRAARPHAAPPPLAGTSCARVRRTASCSSRTRSRRRASSASASSSSAPPSPHRPIPSPPPRRRTLVARCSLIRCSAAPLLVARCSVARWAVARAGYVGSRVGRTVDRGSSSNVVGWGALTPAPERARSNCMILPDDESDLDLSDGLHPDDRLSAE